LARIAVRLRRAGDVLLWRKKTKVEAPACGELIDGSARVAEEGGLGEGDGLVPVTDQNCHLDKEGQSLLDGAAQSRRHERDVEIGVGGCCCERCMLIILFLWVVAVVAQEGRGVKVELVAAVAAACACA